MPADLTLAAAFMVGLLGSVHCLGMCGGIVGASSLGLPGQDRQHPLGRWPYLLAYNTGRIASYSAAGALAGLLGGQLDQLLLQRYQIVGHYVAGGFMIALGLYIAGWWRGLTVLEQAGVHLWRRLEPHGRRFLPLRHPAQALGLGLVWGWLPCGLVYSALVWSLTAASAARGAALMFAFGLGTLPMLLAMGGSAAGLAWVIRRPLARALAGAAILILGLYTLSGNPLTHDHHALPIQSGQASPPI